MIRNYWDVWEAAAWFNRAFCFIVYDIGCEGNIIDGILEPFGFGDGTAPSECFEDNSVGGNFDNRRFDYRINFEGDVWEKAEGGFSILSSCNEIANNNNAFGLGSSAAVQAIDLLGEHKGCAEAVNDRRFNKCSRLAGNVGNVSAESGGAFVGRVFDDNGIYVDIGGKGFSGISTFDKESGFERYIANRVNCRDFFNLDNEKNSGLLTVNKTGLSELSSVGLERFSEILSVNGERFLNISDVGGNRCCEKAVVNERRFSEALFVNGTDFSDFSAVYSERFSEMAAVNMGRVKETAAVDRLGKIKSSAGDRVGFYDLLSVSGESGLSRQVHLTDEKLICAERSGLIEQKAAVSAAGVVEAAAYVFKNDIPSRLIWGGLREMLSGNRFWGDLLPAAGGVDFSAIGLRYGKSSAAEECALPFKGYEESGSGYSAAHSGAVISEEELREIKNVIVKDNGSRSANTEIKIELSGALGGGNGADLDIDLIAERVSEAIGNALNNVSEGVHYL